MAAAQRHRDPAGQGPPEGEQLPVIAEARPAQLAAGEAGWALSPGGAVEVLLSGTLPVPEEEAAVERDPVVLVVVDDNSGSMGCSAISQCSGQRVSRVDACRDKTRALLDAAERAGLPYCYATFTHRVHIHGRASPHDVDRLLDNSGGTALCALAEAATQSAFQLVTGSERPVRIVFVLNTDGEASDASEAAQLFNDRYAQLCATGKVASARTFVLGIGPSHDHRLLGAISVGEASYFNYPDGELSRMAADALQHVAPELTGARRRITLRFLPTGREEAAVAEEGAVSLGGISLCPGEHELDVPGIGVVPLAFRPLEQGTHEYWAAYLRLLQRDALAAAAEARSCVGQERQQERAREVVATVQRLRARLEAVPDDATAGLLHRRLRAAVQAGDGAQVRHITAALRNARVKEQRHALREAKVAVRDAVALCADSARALSTGMELHRDIERDMMEFLSSGGFARYSDRRKRRLVGYAQEKAAPDAIATADAKALEVVGELATIEELPDGEGPCCWLTLQTGQQLAQQGDVLCIAGHVPPGARRMALTGVNSAAVLHNAILRGDVTVCTQPISFLALRELLQGGDQIQRGPDGAPINAAFCVLPAEGSQLSHRLARLYQPLCTSQVLTSRWVFTERAGEFRNGLLASLMCIAARGAGGADRRCMRECVAALRSVFGERWAGECAARHRAFYEEHKSTSGEVPSTLTALGDAFVAAAASAEAPPCAFWQEWVLRVLRDAVARWAKQDGSDPEQLLELAVQGLNAPPEAADGLALELQPLCASAAEVLGGTREDVEERELVALLGALSLSAYEPDPEPEAGAEAAESEGEDDPPDGGDDEPGAKRGRAATAGAGGTRQRFPLASVAKALLREAKGCAARGAPRDVAPVDLERMTPLQRVLAEAGAAQTHRELRLALNAGRHLSELCGEQCRELSLAQLVGVAPEELHRWLLTRLVLALRLRDNSHFRAEVTREGAGLLCAEPAAVLSDFNTRLAKRQREAWLKAERAAAELRRMRLHLRFRRCLLSMRETPEQWGCFIPLRIADEAHLRQINAFTSAHRGFLVEPTETPDGRRTGMAVNTMLSRGSRFFLREANAKEAIHLVWGGRGRGQRTGDAAVELGFCAPEDGLYAHVASLNLMVTAVQQQHLLHDYRAFVAAVRGCCPPFSIPPCMDPRLAELWASMQLAKPEMLARPAVECESALLALLPPGDTAAAEVVRTVAAPLHRWYTDPAGFASDPAYALPEPTFEEFMQAAAPTGEEEEQIAREAFAAPLETLRGPCTGQKRKRGD